MAPAVVYLHIGSPKTGTTYLQSSLWANKEVLAAEGVMLGRSRESVNRATGDLLKWRARHGDLPASWRRLCRDAERWSGRSLVLSQEHLHKATDEQFAALVESFPGARLEIVLTARDLARAVPAQWQSSVRQRYTWTLGDYADAVTAAAPGGDLAPRNEASGAAAHFWGRQDSPAILHCFVERLSLEQVRVVTVPASGGDPDELWRRFCRACDLGTSTTPGEVSHESLGAASAEIMRRLNGSGTVEALTLGEYKKAINHILSRHALAPRRAAEPGLTLPERHRDWAEQEAEQIIARIVATGVEVIGDLEDLRPQASSKPYVDPDQLPPDTLLEAALDGLAGMAVQHLEVRAELKELTRAASTSARAIESPVEPPVEATPDQTGGIGRVLRRLQRGS